MKNYRIRQVWRYLFVTVFIAFTSILPLAAEESGFTIKPLNPAFVEFLEKEADSRFSYFESNEMSFGLIPSPIDFSYLKERSGVKRVKLSHPAAYDLRSNGKLTPVTNQESCGACWTFATYSVVESRLLPAETWDFSENNMNNNHGFDRARCDGGNKNMALAYLARWDGPITEADDPFESADIIQDKERRKHVQGAIWGGERGYKGSHCDPWCCLYQYVCARSRV